ncbi:hypothetical protein GN244_ATG19730 [Phytophthora infestans]|uniref:WRKY19-like zinc finger domain-containing protein n=1 Tax=Phytophthora infestans TaxID=4787 RepID=A0A833VU06_PHYIN|nr:hypothetical protein GN244_ATG19730 [Phytophthora infestans]
MASLEYLLSSDTGERQNHNETTLSGANAKPNSRRCSVPGCQKTAKRGGRCISHGGGNKCAVDGCSTSVVSRGLCVAHGGGKRCQTQGCTKSAQSGGFCWVHGGGKKCGYHGCSKRAQSGGACIAHGGGKRCRIDRCNKVVQYEGLCVGHGGYRRCVFDNCNKRSMANDYCQHHGGSSICLLEYCFKRAVRGGMCSEHKADVSMQPATANKLTRTTQYGEDRVNKAHWSSRLKGCEATRKSSSEPRVPSAHLYKDIATPSPVRSVDHEIPTGSSPRAPGFSALLNANERFSSFETSYSREPDLSAERCLRRQHYHERKVFPLLPSIRTLQNYRKQAPSIPHASFADPGATPSRSELRAVVTEDRERMKRAPSTEVEYREGEDYKLYVTAKEKVPLYI